MGSFSVTLRKLTNMNSFLLILGTFVIGGLSAPQPQYGGGGSPSVSAPQRQSGSSVECRTEYQEVWDTQYTETETEECQTLQQRQCYPVQREECRDVLKQACETLYRPKCITVNQQVCETKQKTEYYTETECGSELREDCEYRWKTDNYGGKEWVPIPGTCTNNNYDKCQDVQKENLVDYPECRNVPTQDCSQQEAYQDCRQVPKKECNTVTDQECRNEPYQKCEPIHKKVPNRISRKVPKKVCSGQGSGVQPVLKSAKPEKQIDTRKGSDAVKFGK